MRNLQLVTLCIAIVIAGVLASGGRYEPVNERGLILDRWTGQLRVAGMGHIRADEAAAQSDTR